jgi:riboflavin kinase/FMN adenylyltransferase
VKIYTSLEKFKNVNNPVLTTGTFDGVHLGHKKILRQLRLAADQLGGETVLFTFQPHPRMILFPDAHDLKLLNTLKEKIEQLEKTGLEHLILFPFSLEFSRLSATEYVRDVLVNQLKIKKLIIGYDHHFGRNREGSAENLKELAPIYHFDFEEIPVQVLDDVSISSTKIRRAIEQGDVKTAQKFLGYHYPLNGVVVDGNKKGRTIGFPTANLKIEDNTKLLPGNGVYAVRVIHREKVYKGMLNIGFKPTITDNKEISIEVNIFDFESEDLYEQNLKIELIDWIRDEKKFASMEELKQQLGEDRVKSEELLNV